MCQNFVIRVEIKEELERCLIFKKIQARLPTAVILGYFGYKHQVMPLMQTLSHKTRAYAINANSLPGFVIDMDFIGMNLINVLKNADEKGQLDHVKKWQVIELDILGK